MRTAGLRVRRVRRYRMARYPARSPAARARRGGPLGERVLRLAAGPAAALGIGVAGGACEGGVNLVGDAPDATDATDATGEDVDLCTDYTLTTPVGIADCYVRYLTEAEGREVIREVVHTETGSPTDPCAHPTLDERLTEDLPFRSDLAPDPSVPVGTIDLLAPEISVEPSPPCPGAAWPTVGFEFMTDEAGDDEGLSGNPAGLTDDEEALLADLRARHEVGIAVLRATDYPYRFVELMDGRFDDTDRVRAEDLLRAAVRTLLDDLRRDGMI
jgi:hypothetical protein